MPARDSRYDTFREREYNTLAPLIKRTVRLRKVHSTDYWLDVNGHNVRKALGGN